MRNNKLLQWCPFKVNKSIEEHFCDGSCCAWFITDPKYKHRRSQDIGECAVKKIAKNIDNIYDLLLNRV